MPNSPSDTADHANTVIAFYATSLSHTVGRGYVPPNLSSLARWWFDVSSMTFLCCFLLRSTLFISPVAAFCFTGELRLAARTLFDAGVAGLTDEEKISLVDRWQHSRKRFITTLHPMMTADFGRPYSTFFASRIGKKVSRRLKGSTSLRVYCCWSTQSALHQVGVFPFFKYGGFLMINPS